MRPRANRIRLAVFGTALGAVVAGAALMNGDVGFAIFAVVLMGAFSVFSAFSETEWAVIGRAGEADERQRSINDEAVHVAYFAVIAVGLGGFLVEVARGTPGPFTLMCAVGGFTHMGTIAYLRRRR